MRIYESWQPIADTLGFKDVEEMIKHLYVMQGFSLEQMHQIIGYSTWSIRRRLIEAGIPMKGRGGPNNRTGKRRLKHLTDSELENTRTVELAAKHQVHISTVYAEIRFREREKRNAILSDHADKLFSRVGSKNQDPHGLGAVLPAAEVSGVLPEEG